MSESIKIVRQLIMSRHISNIVVQTSRALNARICCYTEVSDCGSHPVHSVTFLGCHISVKLRRQQHAQELQEEVSFVGRELHLNIYLCG